LAIYLAIIGSLIVVGLAVVPPLVAQARDLWAQAPGKFDEFQRFLIRYHLMTRRVTIQEAVQNAPAGSGGNAVNTVFAAISGVFAAIGLGLMGEPYFFVVALIAAVGETVPIVGPIVGGIAAVGVAATTSTKLAVMVGIYFFALHQLEANVLVPKIMERRVGVS